MSGFAEGPKVDHVAEAEAMLDGSNPHGSSGEAQAHATLALVEQMTRIANVLESVTYSGTIVTSDGGIR